MMDTCPFFKYDDNFGEQCILEGGVCRECLDPKSPWFQQPCKLRTTFFEILEKVKASEP